MPRRSARTESELAKQLEARLRPFVEDVTTRGVSFRTSLPSLFSGRAIITSFASTLAGSLVYPNHIQSTYGTSVDNGALRNMFVETNATPAHDMGTLAGLYAITTNTGTQGNTTHMQGLVGRAVVDGLGDGGIGSGEQLTVEVLTGVWGDYTVEGLAVGGSIANTVVSNGVGFYVGSANVAAGTVTRSYGVYINDPTVTTGTVVNNYGIYIKPMDAGSASNYGIYIDDPGGSGYGIYNNGPLYQTNVSTFADQVIVGALESTVDNTYYGATAKKVTISGDLRVFDSDSVGSNLVSNPTFDADTTGWTAGGIGDTPGSIASVAGGQSGNCLEVTTGTGGTVSNGYAWQAVTTVAGKLYRVSGYYKRGTSNLGSVGIGTASSNVNTAFQVLPFQSAAVWTFFELFFVASQTTSYLRLSNSVVVEGRTSLFDEVALEEVTGGDVKVAGLITGYGGTAGIKVLHDGKVGIGTTTPGSMLSIVGLPTSTAGLSAGDVWSDSGTLKIVT